MTRIPLSVRIGSRLARCFSHSFIISASLPDPFIIAANGIINPVISPAETSFPAIPAPINCSTNGSKYRIPIRYITNMAAELIPVLTRTALIYSSQSRSLSSSLCRSEVFFLRNIFNPLGNFPLIHLLRIINEDRSCKGCDDRYAYNDRIQKITDHTK